MIALDLLTATWFAVFVVTAVAAEAAFLLLQVEGQRIMDTKLVTYALTFPKTLAHDQATRLVSVLGGLYRAPRGVLGYPEGRVILYYQVFGTERGINHLLMFPAEVEVSVLANLQATVPGIGLEQVTTPNRKWRHELELTYQPAPKPKDEKDPPKPDPKMVAALLSGLSRLGEGEAAAVSMALCPAPLDSETAFYARMKLGVDAQDVRAKKLMNHLIDSYGHLRLFRIPKMRFDHPMRWPVQLPAEDLSVVMALPIGAPDVPGMAYDRGRKLIAAPQIPQGGPGFTQIGVSNWPGSTRMLALGMGDLTKHMHVLGSNGCLHPLTPIYDPVDDTTKTVRARAEEGLPFHVLALDGQNVIVTRAEAPRAYWRAPMFRLRGPNSEIIVTAEHRVWDGQAYRTVSELVQRRGSGRVLLPSIAGPDLSRLLSDARRWTRIHADSPADCRSCCRSRGPQPRSAIDSAPGLVPSLGDARGRSHSWYASDGRGPLLGDSHQRQHAHLPAKSGSQPGACLSYVRGDQPPSDTCLLTSGSRPYGAVSQAQVGPIERVGRTHRSAPASTPYCDLCGRCPHTSWQSGTSRQLDGISHKCHSLVEPAWLFQHVFQAPSLTPAFPLHYYSQTTTFWVEPAGDETYYDFHVPVYENYYAQGLFHHNTGKTTFLENLMVQAADQGYGFTFIDPHGDAFENVLDRIPPARRDDVIVLDLTDGEFPVGFNALDGDPYLVTSQIMAIFDRLFDIFRMPQTADVLRSTVLTLAHKGFTLLDVPAVLAPTKEGQRLRDAITTGLKDPALGDFWRMYDAYASAKKMELTAPVVRRLRPFETWPSLRGTLGQTDNGFNFDDVFAQSKIILLNLKQGLIGEEEGRLFGSLFVTRFWNSVQRRSRLPESERKPYLLVVDEFQHYVNLPVSFSNVLAESRKYGLGFVLSHQMMGQLPHDLREAVLTNARNKVVFNVSAGDATLLARELSGVAAEDMLSLDRHEIVTRLVIDGSTMAPATAKTLPPLKSRHSARAVQASSRKRYGKPLLDVERDIRSRQRPPQVQRQDPIVGVEKLPGATDDESTEQAS